MHSDTCTLYTMHSDKEQVAKICEVLIQVQREPTQSMLENMSVSGETNFVGLKRKYTTGKLDSVSICHCLAGRSRKYFESDEII